MKNLQRKRLVAQLLFLLISITGFFINYQSTMMLIILATLLGGAFFCGWICPFGTIQDLISRLGRSLGIKKKKMPKSIHKILIYTRYIILVLVTLFATDLIFSIISYDPRANLTKLLTGNVPTIAAVIVILAFSVTALFYDRPFCNYLCMEGAKYSLMSSVRLVTIQREQDKCVNCKKCDKSCPMNIEVSKINQLTNLQCINCFNCISACPIKKTLTYKKVPFNKSTKKRYLKLSTALVLGVIALFIYDFSTNQSLFNFDIGQNEPAAQEVNIDVPEVSESITAGEAEGISDGVYTGTGEGYNGSMTVEVTVENEIITNIEVTEHSDDRSWFNRANKTIPKSIIEDQSTDVNTVSGASYSSQGIIDAVKNALESAR